MMRALVASLVFAACVPLSAASAGESSPNNVRVIVRVAPRAIGKREQDEMPAEFRLRASDFAPRRRIDPSSLEIVRWDPHPRDRAIGGPLPLRWYDDAVPYACPASDQNLQARHG